MMATSNGAFFHSQTVPTDLHGSVWDTTATEGPQNFHGDAEDFSFAFGHITPRGHGQEPHEAVDDMCNKWIATEEPAVLVAEPMRRISSRSSSGSQKHRTIKASSHKTRPRILSTMSQESHMSNFDVSGNAQMDSYLIQDTSDAQSVSSQMYYPMPMTVGLATDGMPYSPDALASTLSQQHMDPTQMQLDFDPGLTGNSPTGSGGSSLSPIESRISSPGLPEDSWTAVSVTTSSPQIKNSPSHMDVQSPSLSIGGSSGLVPTDEYYGGDLLDNSFLPPPFSRRSTSDGDSSARDHPLYKSAVPQADGLFHCPWEGQSGCNHKPEKLKCNYDKFVDSHLKPYRCKADSCENARFSSTACLLRHEREAHAMHGHGDKPYLCTYEGCDRAIPGCGFPRNWNLRDHMRRVHNDNGQSLSSASGASSSGRGSQSQSAKGRKRKSKDSSEASAGRKVTSSKSGSTEEAADAAAKAAEQPLVEEWWEHRNAVQTYLEQYDSPEAFNVLEQSFSAAEHFTAMENISRKLKKSRHVHRRTFAQNG